MPSNPFWVNKNWNKYFMSTRPARAVTTIARAYRKRLGRKHAIRQAEFGKSYRSPWMKRK